ncbi:MAG: response regulator, partial [Eubacterium sp.]|nr:response regulator [Eubacterium sp.]
YSDCMPNAERNLTSSLEFVLSADDKAIGRKFTDFSTLDTRVKWNESEDMLSFSFESPSIGWVKASFLATDFDEEGNVQKVIYLLQDISKEKKDEKVYQDKIAHLIEQRKHEDVLQQEFFARMSATLRNPLNGITGTVDVLRKVADDEDKVLCYAGKIEQSSLNLLTLIKDMSEMSEMESGKLTFVDEPNNIWDLIHDISTIVEPVAEKSSVNFEKKKSGRIAHPDIVCSGGHFRYLLRVILCNAIAACEAGDTVCLAFKEQDMFGDKASFLFVIEDNGSGERNETELPVCRQIVEKMGGVMQVENRLETGMKVSMMLPFEVEESWKEHLDKEEHTLFRGKRVLLVEDNELNLEIAQFLLEDAGAKVTTAVDGEEAIALYEQSEEGEYDIIMMDIMMPKMDGLTAATEIRKKKRRDAITVPILAMSANAMSGDREKSLDAGMNAHVCKPLNMNKLVSAAKELMNREGIC